jgi:hypothetical protein
MANVLHVTVSGDIAGEYVFEKQPDGGRIVLALDTGYPSAFPERPGRLATTADRGVLR